jgi:hypothetical protein
MLHGERMQDREIRFVPLATKIAVCHTITYLVMGAIAYNLFHYEQMINAPNSGMRHMDDPVVILGTVFQPLRGLLFASIFYPIRKAVFGRRFDWLLMAWILVGMGILGTFAAPAGSLEGFIYTTTPFLIQIRGYVEIVTQAVLLSVLTCWWLRHPEKKWLNWVLGAIFAIAIVMPVLGVLVKRG